MGISEASQCASVSDSGLPQSSSFLRIPIAPGRSDQVDPIQGSLHSGSLPLASKMASMFQVPDTE
jgi:hypothetical protein